MVKHSNVDDVPSLKLTKRTRKPGRCDACWFQAVSRLTTFPILPKKRGNNFQGLKCWLFTPEAKTERERESHYVYYVMFDIFFLLATWNLNDDPCLWLEWKGLFFSGGPRPSNIREVVRWTRWGCRYFFTAFRCLKQPWREYTSPKKWVAENNQKMHPKTKPLL